MAPRDGAAFGTALLSQFHGDHNIEDLLRRDEDGRSAENGVANVRVELAPVADGGHALCSGVAVPDKNEFV